MLGLLLFAAAATEAGQLSTRTTGAVNWTAASTWIEPRTGSVSFSNGSTTVTGTGTSFTTELQVGDVLMLSGGPTAVKGTVASITNNTSLTLVAGAQGGGSGAYGRQRAPVSTDTVAIGNSNINQDITVTLDASATVRSIIFAGTNGANTLQHSGSNSLTVTNSAVINQPTANSKSNSWLINAGSATVGDTLRIGGTNTTTTRRSIVTLTTGSLGVTNSVVFNSAGATALTAQITLTGASPVLSIGGNLVLANGTGTLSPGTSGTVRFNGAGAQSFATASSIAYANITVDKSGGSATPSASDTLTGDLSVLAGTLDLQGFTLNRLSAGGTLTVSSGASLLIGGTNGFPTNYSTHTLGATSTVWYTGTTQTVAKEPYGHLRLGGGTKTLPSDTLDLSGDFRVESGATANAGALMTMYVGGNWLVEGTFTPGSGAVVFDGSAQQSITGGSFSRLRLFNAAGAALGSNISASDSVALSSGALSTGSYSLTLGPSATLAESGNNLVNGTVLTTRTVVQTSGTVDFGNIGASITLNGTAPGSTTVTRTTGAPSTGNGNNSILRTFSISPAVNTGLDADLAFRYADADLSGHQAEQLRLFKSTDNGSTWTDRGGSVDTANRTLSLGGLNGFSSWTASDPSNSLGDPPVPALSTAEPDSKYVGESGFTMTVTGSEFVGTSVVRLDGIDLPTTYLGETSLSATVDDSLLEAAGTASVTVNTPGGGTSSGVDFVVLQGQTLASVTAGPDSMVYGDTTTFTVGLSVVSPASGTPSGTITLTESGDTLASVAADPSGSTDLSFSLLEPGDYSIIASYSGSADYLASADTFTLHVAKGPSAVALQVIPSPSEQSEEVTLEAVVSGATPITDGTVTFYDGAVALSGPIAVDSTGFAEFATSALTVGPHSLSASYSGNQFYEGSADTAMHGVECPDLVVTPGLLLDGKVDSAYQTQFSTTPAGLHTYTVSTGTLPAGVTLSSSGLLSGTPQQGGTFNFTVISVDTTGCADTLALTLTVGKEASAASIVSDLNPSIVGDTVNFTVTLSPAAATGSVEFFDGAASLGSSPVSGAEAVLSVDGLAEGVHAIHAVYSGDTAYLAVASDTVMQTVLSAQLAIAATAGANGSISPSGTVMVDRGASQSFDVVPDTGYHIDSVVVNGVNEGAISQFEFTNVQDEHTIDAYFSVNTYTVTASASAGGSVSPSGVTNVNHGGSQSYTITPDTGYHVDSVVVNGTNLGVQTSHDFTNVTANQSIDAYFSVNVYDITSTASAGGSISPSGVTNVNHGGSQSYTITPDSGYHIDSVVAGGVNQGAVGNYDFTNVAANQTIDAYFSINAYTITATASAGGSVSPSGVTNVSHGGSQSYTISANVGYHVDSVVVNGSNLGVQANHDFTNVTANQTIDAYFSVNVYTITAAASAGGSISPSGVTNVNHGGSQSYTITANSGYHIDSVVAGGVNQGTVGNYDFTSVSANQTIDAYFSINAYTVTATASAGGSISPSGVTNLSHGGSQSYTISANVGYHIDSVVVNGSNLGVQTSHDFTNVTANQTIDAYFSINVYTVTATASAGGSVSPSGVTNVNHGASQSYTITANVGYHIDSVVVNGSNLGVQTAHNFTNVTANQTINAYFSVNAYTVTASASAGGSVSPSGVTNVSHGGSQSYTISANVGYHIDSVVVSGSNLGVQTAHNFTNVTANQTINAYFSINVYSITATASAGGSVSPSGVTWVSHGGSQLYTIAPDSGYMVDSVFLDGGHVGAPASLNVDNVAAAHTVHAAFRQLEFVFPVAAEWNLLSVGLAVGDNRVTTLFPTAAAPVYEYDGTSHQVVDSAWFGTGYWVKFASTDEYTLSGAAVMSAELSLRKGWNIIGSISAPVHVDAVTADPPGLIWTDYFGYEDGYYIADSIVPGRGYWVKTTVAGTIGLEAGAVATPATAAHRRKSAADRVGRGGLNELVITPAAAPGRQVRSGTLWFGDIADADLPSFDLPPLPPGNGFDARFATHRNGARIGAGAVEETQLLVQGPAGGAELKWNVADAGNGAQAGTAYLVGRVANRVVSRMKMSGSGSTQIVTDGTVRYAVSYEAVPKSVALLQNYPNPFNPATEIGFELPAATEVSLAVYDLTGRLVAQLISGETLEAGSHTTHFDAAQLASGVYYYRLTAPGFTAVKKMALVR